MAKNDPRALKAEAVVGIPQIFFHGFAILFVAAGPVSRILSAVAGRTVIPLGHALLRGSSDLPGGCGAPSRHASPAKPEGLPGNPSLFGLAPCGVCPARRITAAAVRSYRTFSPLPEPRGPAVCFLWHFPSNASAYKSAGALPDVIRHTALRSSDFPPVSRRATVRSGCQQIHYSAGRKRRQRVPAGLRFLTLAVWARGRIHTTSRQRRPEMESVRRDRPARLAPTRAEAP